MTIRPAKITDLADLRMGFEAMVREGLAQFPAAYPNIHDEDFDNWTLGMYRHLAGNPLLGCFVACDDMGKVIGFAAVEIMERLVGWPLRYGYGHWLWVHPAMRGAHVGSALMLAAFGWMRERGITHAETDMRPGDNQWLRRGAVPVTQRVASSLEGLIKHLQHERVAAKDDAQHTVASIRTPKKKRGRPKKKKDVPPEARANGSPT